MNTEQYFILVPKQVGEKTEVVVIKQFMAENYAAAMSQFQDYLSNSNSINKHFLVAVLGKGYMEVEMKFKFEEDGAHAN